MSQDPDVDVRHQSVLLLWRTAADGLDAAGLIAEGLRWATLELDARVAASATNALDDLDRIAAAAAE